MWTRLQRSTSESGRFRATLLILLVAAIFLGSVADAFHLHPTEAPGETAVQLTAASADDGPLSADPDIDCGIHLGCSAVLIPDNPVLAEPLTVSAGRLIVLIRSASAADRTPYHPPKFS